jgi:hypothetical protein
VAIRLTSSAMMQLAEQARPLKYKKGKRWRSRKQIKTNKEKN